VRRAREEKGVRSLDGSDEGVRALRERRAYVRPNARVVAVRGANAEGWLQDLVTAGVVGLPNGGSVRSLVLSPTGRIRAEVHVVRSDDECLLVQSLDQPEAVDAVLAPYVLSSAVEIAPARTAPVLVPGDDGWHASLEPPTNAVQVDDAAAERWRIESGLALFPVDLDEESLPAEAGLDVPPVTDTAKGCFLGQESIARVRNLGHPTRVVVALVSDASTAPGDAVVTSDGVVGAVTSAAGAGARAAVIARVRWDARDAELRTSSGAALRRHELDTTGPPGFQDFT
jgi:tRNA-modifying protein YgfZ